jgi:F0F1-type ATP synthase membrane subunit b/b'
MEPGLIRGKIAEAKRRLLDAEKAMQTALQAVEPASRAEKTIISSALRTAFAELQAAKGGVLDLERLIAAEK